MCKGLEGRNQSGSSTCPANPGSCGHEATEWPGSQRGHRYVALWKLVVDQLTDQPGSAPICPGAVWDFWLWHFQATSQEVASRALFSTQLGRQTLGWWPHQERREHGVDRNGRHSLVLLAHVTQAAISHQKATHPQCPGSAPFMTTMQEATPLPCPSEEAWA